MFALLLALGIAVSVFPLAEGTDNQVASSYNAKIGLNEAFKHENVWGAKINEILSDKIVKVDAKATIRSLKKSKVTKYKKIKYKKVKAAYKIKVKVRYKYKGKWRYKWVYKSYTPVVQVASPVVPTRNVGAYDVVVTSEYVYATGRCSCSMYTDYNYHTQVFYNYNPSTNRWGVLNFEQGPAPKTSPEGMWYDTITDMDFCLVHGKSHDTRNVFLTPYNGVINGINVVNGYFTDKAVTPTVDTTKTTDSTTGTDTTDSTGTSTTDSTTGTGATDSSNSTNGTNA